MKVLVTGASGFFGSALVPELIEKGHDVVTFGRRQLVAPVPAGAQHPPSRSRGRLFEHRQGDLTDPCSIVSAMHDIDVCIHMAGLVSYRRTDYDKLFEVNVIGTRNVMQAAREAGVRRVVHMSSIAGMGIPPEGEIADETLEYNLAGKGLHYCDTKHLGELEALKFVSADFEVIVLAPGITFGEGDTHPHHHAIFKSMEKGGQTGYPVGGVMFSDIKDVVRTTINAMTMGRSGERYVIGSANLTFREASIELSKVIGGRVPVVPIPGIISETAGILSETIMPLLGKTPKLTWQVAWLSQRKIFFSSDKAARELAHTQTPFAETIKRTAAYYLGRSS